MLIGLDVAASAAHVQLDVDLTITLQRKEGMIAAYDRDTALILDVVRRYRSRRATRDAQHGVLDAFVEGERQ